MIGSPDLKWLGLAWFGGGGSVVCHLFAAQNSRNSGVQQKKRTIPDCETPKTSVIRKRDLSEVHPKPSQNSRNNSVQQDNSC